MADTIEGGAYLVNGGWVNADGKPLNKAQIAAAQALHEERDMLLRLEEEDRLLRAVKNDPMAQVLARALGPQQAQSVAPRGPSALELEQQAIVGVAGRDVADRLFKADYDSLRIVADASDEQLLKIEGVTPAMLKKLRALKR